MSNGLVSCNGCFGILHPGHFFYLGFARGQGRQLVVGINSDRYIRETKGYEPLSQWDREKALMSLGFIREVIVFDEPDPREFIRRVNPDVHCIGEEYRGKAIEEALCAGMGIKRVYIPRIGNWSTTAILRGGMDNEAKFKVLQAV